MWCLVWGWLKMELGAYLGSWDMAEGGNVVGVDESVVCRQEDILC